ncbi:MULTISPECIES: ABC transporter permease [unclassified Paraburkholderia]|uniref:ABC transporter permease n=1 Tax=unclassified Paraburkholderia TaxID=2615204 RepID=UPI0016195886|nr:MULTISPECIES: ABC transporter permease [unclassified Paraburkholderia]MBB5411340.1 NitT/TauT family transport system permease protein [Paraburkholderia sp. HC6.4b]MBB5449875.1 NitT/TauT family transport system permease protein [Paraburkholderia sp. Kb1A]MBC8724787.1 ABC transporter permease [Paraburkholderia sp. 31.1]
MTEAVLSTNVTPRKAVRRTRRKFGTTGAVFGIVVALVLAWQLAVSAGWINGKLLGSPSGIYEAAVIGLTQGTLVSDTWVTLYETLAGLAIGSGLGIGLGLLLWFLPTVSGVAEGLSVILNSIPKIALGPLIVIWFGSDASSKIWLAGISTFAVAMISSCAAAREVDKDLLNLFHSFKAKPSMIFTKLIVPSALPWIFSTLRVNIGFALIGAVVGEYIASQSGLGHAVFVAGSLFDLNTVWLGIIVLTLMASVLSWIVQLAEAKIISWKKK